MTILVIDDNRLAREVNVALVKKVAPKTPVVSVETCSQAVARRFEPMVGIVSDLCMPDVDPVKLLDKLIDAFPGTPLVFMSALSRSDVEHHIIRSRGYTIIGKNERFQDIVRKLEEGLRLQKNDNFVADWA